MAHNEGDDDEAEYFCQQIPLCFVSFNTHDRNEVSIRYLVFVLALDFDHQLEQLFLEVVVILHPSQSAKSIDVILNNVLDVVLVPVLLILIDLNHAQWRASPFHQFTLVSYRISDVLSRNEKLLVERSELVHFDGDFGHVLLPTSHEKCVFSVSPMADMSGNKASKILILMHFGDDCWEKVG